MVYPTAVQMEKLVRTTVPVRNGGWKKDVPPEIHGASLRPVVTNQQRDASQRQSVLAGAALPA